MFFWRESVVFVDSQESLTGGKKNKIRTMVAVRRCKGNVRVLQLPSVLLGS